MTVEDFGAGCSASLRVALGRVDPQSAGIVLMLGISRASTRPPSPAWSARAGLRPHGVPVQRWNRASILV
ncbi:hypothetical protein I551_0217 [Mycobacterium ulcerans str. Harvey]|uniref:Uncharacterized protein n=1 Tax=Mycobacterium ulcerans str. Harvey TaxID=1299332 RepID=A0ABN0R830_MYCUL|nr:hypothetical protein I551_0217 [Mycobacterium ulcerans str. Harvey]